MTGFIIFHSSGKVFWVGNPDLRSPFPTTDSSINENDDVQANGTMIP
jgi:hypothetical protein